MSMDGPEQSSLIERIVNPISQDEALDALGLSKLPSRDQVRNEIEQKLLVPREILPSHWLPTYQMYLTLALHLGLL